MPLLAPTISTLDRFWVDFFGCTPSIFGQSGTIVVPHAALGDYRGLWLFRRDHTLIVSIPPADYTKYKRRFAALTIAALDDRALLTSILGVRIDRMIGPAWIGYLDQAISLPRAALAPRLLTSADDAAYHAFRAAVPAEEWEHGGSAANTTRLAGTFVADTLVALAGYERWGEVVAHISIVCHPAYRGHGYGRSAVSLIAQTALQRGLIPQYRTLFRNAPSMRIAEQLGFVGYADQLAIRLK